MLIREALEDDLDAIAHLLNDDPMGRMRERPGDPAYRAAWEQIRAQGGNTVLVVEIEGEIAGCLQLTLIPGLSRLGAMRAQIEGVRVAKGIRGRGIGQALMEAALDRAREAGAVLVQLTTDRQRDGSLDFYERLGFEATHWGMKRPL